MFRRLSSNGTFVQWRVALTATLTLFSAGMQFSWFSPALDNAQFKDLFNLTAEEISWMVSILNIGAVFGSVLSGFLVNTIGRKWCIFATNFPSIIGWLLVYEGTTATWLYAASIISGVAVGMSTNSVPIYVGEVASMEMRGALGTLTNLMMNVGIFYEFVCGPFVTHWFLAASSCVVPIVCVLCMFFVPESPEYLLGKDRENDARKSLQLLRGRNPVADELARIKKDIKSNEMTEPWLKTLSKAGKPLFIVSFLGFMQQASGSAVLQSYFEEVYILNAPPLKPVIAAIIVSVLGVLTGLLCAWTVEKSGRRILSHLSCGIQTIAYVLLGGFYLFKDAEIVSRLSWLPLVLIVFILVAYNFGQGPLVFVLVGEILPTEVRAMGATSAAVALSLGAFASTKMYPLIEPQISFLSFGGLVFVTGVFYYVIVPETKGKTREEICRLMINEKAKDVNRNNVRV